MLDTYRTVETPEGVELGLRVAGPAPRALAWTADVAIRSAGYLAVAMVVGALGNLGTGLFLLVLFLGEWGYPVIFELTADGATPGKRWLGLRVLHDDGTPVGWTASILRNLLRFADFLPMAYGFGLVTMLAHPDFKRLGDLAAGTVVVHREDPVNSARVPLAEATPPRVPLTPAEQRAVLELASRQVGWNPARVAEIADLATPLTGRRGHQGGVVALVGIANWLLGRR